MLCNKLMQLRPVLRHLAQPTRSVISNIPNETVGGTVGGLEKTVNQVMLIGRIGGDPQKRGSAEHPVVIFSLATNINIKDFSSGDVTQKTDWHRIFVFKEHLRESVYKYAHKGQRAYVSGRINYSEVPDSAGNPRPFTAIIADQVIYLSDKRKNLRDADMEEDAVKM